jgi:hypothetical protein
LQAVAGGFDFSTWPGAAFECAYHRIAFVRVILLRLDRAFRLGHNRYRHYRRIRLRLHDRVAAHDYSGELSGPTWAFCLAGSGRSA